MRQAETVRSEGMAEGMGPSAFEKNISEINSFFDPRSGV